MSGEERSKMESAAIQFFTQVIACHSVNQLFFAKVLCDVIREQGSQMPGSLLGSVPLSGFTRRMLLEVLLEDEKVTVALTASPDFYSRLNITSLIVTGGGGGGVGGGGGGSLSNRAVGCQIHHPRFGAGRGSCSVQVNVNSPCSLVLQRFGGECQL
jgi:baculoviral IAP repeat-containing protein 6